MTEYSWNERRIVTSPEEELTLATKDPYIYHGRKEAIKGIDMQFEENKITAPIGPPGCGKSIFLRSLNRMDDTIDIIKVTGEILYEDIGVSAKSINAYRMRKRIGMVFQRPNPPAKSIYKNTTFAYKRAGVKDKQFSDEIVETFLKQAALWGRVKGDSHKSAFTFSGGQQQRLCIVRAIAVKLDIFLIDESASVLDPVTIMQLKDTMFELEKNYTIIIVMHNMQQAARASDYTTFFYLGDLTKYDKTNSIF